MLLPTTMLSHTPRSTRHPFSHDHMHATPRCTPKPPRCAVDVATTIDHGTAVEHTTLYATSQQPVMLVAAADAPPMPPPPRPRLLEGSLFMMTALLGLQFLALAGATVTGILARRRRLELESINGQLRTINAQLRRQREHAHGEALTSALESVDGVLEENDAGLGAAAGATAAAAPAFNIAALEASLAAPAAAHPTEGFGATGALSLAGARRRLSTCLREARACLTDGTEVKALTLLNEAARLAVDVGDQRASRAVLRVRAHALRNLGDYQAAVVCLQESMSISTNLQEYSGDADTLGELADLYVELGDMERAAELYDLCIKAIQDEDEAPFSALSSTWDVGGGPLD